MCFFSTKSMFDRKIMALLAASANTTETISLTRNGAKNRIHKHASSNKWIIAN